MKLQFKFAQGASEPSRQRVITELARRGAKAVRPLFPDQQDEELANLFVADYDDERAGSKMVEYLQHSPIVEFAELQVRRKLIR